MILAIPNNSQALLATSYCSNLTTEIIVAIWMQCASTNLRERPWSHHATWSTEPWNVRKLCVPQDRNVTNIDKLASRKTGRKFIQQQRSAKQKRVVCSATDGSSSAWQQQQQQYVRVKLKRSALVKIPHKDLISLRFCTCGGMSPKWKSYKAGPNVNTNYHTTPETTFRENFMSRYKKKLM